MSKVLESLENLQIQLGIDYAYHNFELRLEPIAFDRLHQDLMSGRYEGKERTEFILNLALGPVKIVRDDNQSVEQLTKLYSGAV